MQFTSIEWIPQFFWISNRWQDSSQCQMILFWRVPGRPLILKAKADTCHPLTGQRRSSSSILWDSEFVAPGWFPWPDYQISWQMKHAWNVSKWEIPNIPRGCLMFKWKKTPFVVQCRNVRRKSYHMEGWMKTAIWKDYLRRFTVVAEEANECHRVIMKGQDCCWRKVLNMCVCKVEFVKGC